MREIQFRGKRLEIGDWVEGSLIIYPDGDCYIASPSDNPFVLGKFCVDPDTVGQYTGLTDKNGKRIFEGDIFRYGFEEVEAVAVVKFGEFGFGSQFDMNQVGFYVEWNPKAMYYRTDLGFWAKQRENEIIGNIHDNPELLGGTDG